MCRTAARGPQRCLLRDKASLSFPVGAVCTLSNNRFKGILIDDSDSWLVGMPNWVKRFDIDLVSFSRPKQAIDCLEESTVDFVLLDYILEGEFDTAAKLLKSPHGSQLRTQVLIIFVGSRMILLLRMVG